MKSLVHNVDYVFSQFVLNKLVEFSCSPVSGTSMFLSKLDGGTFYIEVSSSSTTALALRYVGGGQTHDIHTFTTTEFGKKIAVTIPADYTNLFVDGDGTYTLKIYSTAVFEKLGEVTFASAYNSNKLVCSGSIGADLAATLGNADNVYVKVSDSNNLINGAVRPFNVFHYGPPSTIYRSDVMWGCPCESVAEIVEGNIYVQYNGTTMPYTGASNDTTIKIEFLTKTT